MFLIFDNVIIISLFYLIHVHVMITDYNSAYHCLYCENCPLRQQTMDELIKQHNEIGDWFSRVEEQRPYQVYTVSINFSLAFFIFSLILLNPNLRILLVPSSNRPSISQSSRPTIDKVVEFVKLRSSLMRYELGMACCDHDFTGYLNVEV